MIFNEKKFDITYNHILYIVQIEQLVLINSVLIDYVCFAEYINNDEMILIGTWKNGYGLPRVRKATTI